MQQKVFVMILFNKFVFVTVNGAIINKFLPKIQDIGVADLWLQQDGATCHKSNDKITLLRETFDENINPKKVPFNWPPKILILHHLITFFGDV